MSEEVQRALLWRLTLARYPLGRWLLRLEVERQRLRADLATNGATVLKRSFDIIASFLGLLALSPFFAVIALLVKLEDGGPVFFSQVRVGKYGKEFKMHKFRSMCLNAEERLQELLTRNHHHEGVTFKLKDDPRITAVGKWLRKFSLDEFPQLFNVLKGQMSLVGPRPPVPREVAKYTLEDRRRLATTPGITCFWQVSGRALIDFSGQVQLDVNYIESQSFFTDMKILLLTVPAVLSGRGAC